ncbi:MAG: translation initiation factor IF-2 [Candidatus Thermoplasmatota archaeon]|nr:translation initiation factor IF-2 [Candidatus Thermoplasmatota archaeon]
MVTRQPIVSVLGHVDHGKTSVLDRIRGSSVADREAGKITQHIGATEVPMDAIERVCGKLMEGRSFKVPGLLFIDTPGHRAFATLRARGGALADIAVVVVDIQEGLMPQTREAIRILRQNQTPFVVAANKIDRLHGWDTHEDQPFIVSLQEQTDEVQDRLQEGMWELIGALHDEGIQADRYDRIDDFTKTVALVPMSALTGEGLADLLLVLTGLAQRYLEESIQADLDAPGKATVLEVKEEKGLGPTLDVILYDGKLEKGQTIVVGTSKHPVATPIRALLKPKPLDEIRDPSDRFTDFDEVMAASGLKVVAPDLEDVTPGAPLYAVRDEDHLEEVREMVASELKADIKLADDGVLIKADTLGSLEALAFEAKDAEIPIRSARVGNVSKRDVIEASTYNEPEERVIFAFNVDILPDAKEALREHEVELLHSDIIYELLDDYEAFQEDLKARLEAEARQDIVFPGKLLFLRNHTFRVSKPAIFGIRVLSGRVRPGQRLIREDGRSAGTVKSLRSGEDVVDEARAGDEIAMAVAGVTVGRQVNEDEVYYVDMPGSDFKALRDFDLSHDEREVMNELADIKRDEEPFWGM